MASVDAQAQQPIPSRELPAGDPLVLPRPPGLLRRFLDRHPRLVDWSIVVAVQLPVTAVIAFAAVDLDWWGVAAGIASTLIGAIALLQRRRHPVIVACVCAAIALVPAPFGATGWAAAMVAIYTLGAYAMTRVAWITFAAISVATVAAGVVLSIWLPTSILVETANAGIGVVVLYLVPLLAGISVGGRRRYERALIARAQDLARERDQQAMLATAAERARIAREMHDVVSHGITVMVTLAEGAAAQAPRDGELAASTMVRVAATGRDALAEMRRLLGVLAEPEDDASRAPQPGTDDLATLIERFRAAGLAVRWTTRGEPIAQRALALAVHRIVQEALTNVLRHAPGARHVDVSVVREGGAVHVTIEDDGHDDGAHGIPSTVGAGRGIIGIRERAALHRGTVEAGPRPGGWVARARRAAGGGRMIRIGIVDDQELVRMGFRMVLEAQDDVEVVGEASDGAEAIALAVRGDVDVLLMDVRMPGIDGIAATERIAAMEGSPRVLVLTTFDLDEHAFAALRAGASGFLLKDARPDELLAAIRAVHAGDAALAPRVTARVIEHFTAGAAADAASGPDPAALDVLTPREREFLVAIAEGLTNDELAQRFVIAESTVKTHVGRLLQKLDARDRVQLVITAYEHGLVG